jgi:hypothetical protein
MRADKSTSEAWLSYIQAERCPDAEPLADYQKLVAEHWYSRNLAADDLLREQQGTVFGCRALAYLCLKTEPLADVAIELSARLSAAEQYRLANELYSRLYRPKSWGGVICLHTRHPIQRPTLILLALITRSR